ASASSCWTSMPARRARSTPLATMRQQRVGALLVGGNPFFSSRRQQIVALAARDAIPAMYTNREFVEEGGLISYGNDTADGYRRPGVYVGRILNGASPSDNGPTCLATVCARFTMDCGKPAMSRAGTWRSSIAGRRAETIACRHWRPNWFAIK